MDIISKRASRFAEQHLRGGISGSRGHKRLIEQLDSELYEIDDTLDKIKFINIVLEKNNLEFENHKLECNNPSNCNENYAYENIAYDLNKDLKSLGVKISEDAFTSDEKRETELNLEQMLSDLKNGQEVIYEDLMKEINDLRELYFLGKKTWMQLLLGKGVDMVASGIISETVSKGIIKSVENTLPKLLE